jgi:hypothetical protein
MSQELKTKKSSMELAFNSPENPQTKIRTRFLMGGEPAEQINNSLRSMAGNIENPRMVFGELRIKVSGESAQTHVGYLNASLQRMLKMELVEHVRNDRDKIFNSIKKIYNPDDNTVAIVVAHDMPKKAKKIPEDILIKLRHAGQSFNIEADLGTSAEELLNDDAPIIE